VVMNNYYGDKTRWFIGTVVDGTPPFGYEGRVRVRIHGVHNPSTRYVSQNDLPWAQCVIPTTEGGVSGIGSSPDVKAGALVFGMFMDGKESQVPLIIGSLPHTEYPTPIQQSLAYDDLADRVDPNIEFYNQSISTLDEGDVSIKNLYQGEEPLDTKTVEIRRDMAVKFFLSNGYTIKQSTALVASISKNNSSFNTVQEKEGNIGLMGWNGVRYTRLKAFTNQWFSYTGQLAFILYELNTSHTEANIRILNSDIIDKSKGKALGDIIGRHYAPITGDYNSEVKRVYEIYANKKV
jgi:hypothetical protein